jgi:hypothetical protein
MNSVFEDKSCNNLNSLFKEQTNEMKKTGFEFCKLIC